MKISNDSIRKLQSGGTLFSQKRRNNYVESSPADKRQLLDETRNRDINKMKEDKYQRWKSTYAKGDIIPVEYQDRHLNETVRSDNSFKTQFGEALQLPLRYMTSPDKLVGDAASSVAPNS